MSETKIMLGNEAIARGAYEAGVKVIPVHQVLRSVKILYNTMKYMQSGHRMKK